MAVTCDFKALADLLPVRVIMDAAAMAAYREDRCLLTAAGFPGAVVRARSADDVSTALRGASSAGVSVVPRGAGSGLAGAANAIDGCVVLSLERMNKIIEIDSVARTATVEPGVLNSDLDLAARAHGLFYAPDPGSRSISTVGGNIATNAGGMCCVKYGVTSENVLSLKATLASGETFETGRRTRKDVAGLDLTRLLVGSEGTLAVVVEACVKLRPVPAGRSTVVATFPSMAAATSTVLALSRCVTPAAVEVMDLVTIRAVNRMTQMGIDEQAAAVLLIVCDGNQAPAEVSVCVDAAKQNGADDVFSTDDADEGHALMEARRVALTALERQGTVLLDDVCVPVHRLPELIAAIGSVAKRRDVTVATFGHAADGNLHPTVVYDASDRDAAQHAREAFSDIVEAAIALGGTISGEHGIGMLKLPFLGQQCGSLERDLMHRIRQAFDPAGILNPTRGY